MPRVNKREFGKKKSVRKKIPKKVSEKRDAKKEEFLKKLEDMPIIQVVASQIGIHRSTYYRWCEEDPDFRDRADKALKSGEYFISDMMESLLIKEAKAGKITPMIFWLKHHSPKYMEIRRYEHFHRHEFEENPLTEERKEQIYQTMKAWDDAHKDYEDERPEDYDGSGDDIYRPKVSPYDENGDLIK